MKKENIPGSTASPPGFSATQASEGGPSPLRSVLRGKWMAWIVLLAALFITFFAWYLARGVALERANNHFVFQVQTIEAALYERLHACAFLLQSGAGLFAGSGEVTRAQWRAYVTALQIEKYYPGVQGLGFSKRILPSEKKAHIRQIREAGFPNYDIYPDGERPEYTAIIFLEPFDWRNQRAFGYDMFSEPTRKEAMVNARDTGLAAMSGKVTLLQETEKDVQAGFLMYLPVYRKGEVPETLKQRREMLTGYVYSPFRMNDFMQGIQLEKREYVELQLFDGDKPLKDALLYSGGEMDSLSSHSDPPHLFTHQSIMEYGGHRWLLAFTSSPYFEETIDTKPGNTLLLFGITVSLLLFAVALSLIKSHNQALSLANMSLDLEKTNLGLRREIEERKQATEALRESEEKFRNLFNSAEVGMFRTRFDGSEILAMNQKLLDLFGRTRGEVQSLPSVIHWAEPKEREALLRRLEVEGRVLNFEGRLLNKQGEVRTCIMSVVLYREQGILEGSILDITERKKIENQLSESEQKYRLIADNMVDIIAITDMNLRFTYVSPSVYRIRGFSAEEVMEQTFEQVMTPESLQIIFNAFEEAMRLEASGTADPDRTRILELEEYKKDGSTVWVENTLSFIRDKDQKPMGILSLTRDITERKRADEKLQQYTAELAKRNKELQDALANIRQLSGMLPICASCKKIRDDKGYWSEVESYISEHTQTVFSHGMCPDCEKRAYEDLEDLKNEPV